MIVYVVRKGHRSETRLSSPEIEAIRCAGVKESTKGNSVNAPSSMGKFKPSSLIELVQAGE
jgi:hypothetical protein